MQKYTKTYVLFVAFIVVFSLGVLLGQYEKKEPAPVVSHNGSEMDFRTFWQAWDFVEKSFVEQPVAKEDLYHGAIAGSVASLGDPYSVFLDPETSERFQRELAGSFEGIGAEIGIKNETLTIIAPLEGTPAQQAGLLAGDMVLAVDGLDTASMNLDYAVSLIRGEKGTDVVLTVLSKGEDEVHEVTITRDTIVVESVRFEVLPGGIAHLKLMNFNQRSDSEFQDAIRNILDQDTRGLVLDLRNNPGGYLEDAIYVASFWVKNGKMVVSERFSDGQLREYRARGRALLGQVPTVVLINEGSASGAEIVAAALQDHDLATVVGETSFGKGSVQEVKEFEDGSSLKLTVAKWLTPSGAEINGEGVAPDEEVELTREDYDNDRDPQLDRALEILNQK